MYRKGNILQRSKELLPYLFVYYIKKGTNLKSYFFCHMGLAFITFLYTLHASSWAPGMYPMLIKNSPTISPPVNLNVFLKSFTHSSFVLGCWARSHFSKLPCS